MMTHRSSRGFTLMEVLIASALIGLVMALSMQGFQAISKANDLSRSKMEGQTSASKALQEVSQLLKRAHIIYFTALPLGVQNEANLPTTALAMNPAIANNNSGVGSIPDLLRTLAGGPQDIQYLFGTAANPANLSDHTPAGLFGPANRYRRQQFRFVGVGALTGATRLRSGDPSAVAGFDRDFSSPLCYWAEATFMNAPDAVNNRIQAANIPVRWTFYVLYLAPMSLPREHAALSFAGPPYNFQGDFGRRRAIAANAPANLRVYPRSTVPLELRLLRIPDVLARRTNAPENAPANLPTDPAEAGSGHFLGAPFDHYRAGPVGSIPGQQVVNYDPYKIPMQAGAAATLDRSVSRAGTVIFGSGERVNGGGNHGNYNNIGNDPPTDAALAYRRLVPVSTPTDKVIAEYIDPDNVLGTTVMLGNNLTTDAEYVANPTTPRWLAAYQGPHLWNFNNAWIPTGDKPPPRRALISITTRYRNNRRIPFQFATEATEVELEAVVSYQSSDRTKRE